MVSAQNSPSRKLQIVLCASAWLALIGAFCVGMFTTTVFLVVLGLTAAVAAVSRWRGRMRLCSSVMLAIIFGGVTVVAAELALRPVLAEYLCHSASAMLIQRWPRYPEVARYKPNVSVSRSMFGDLAAMARDHTVRETRDVVFETDSRGFRNTAANDGQPHDLLILGDSFTVGAGTTQDATWGSLLSIRHDLNVYNLAVPGSPWQCYVNLALEIDRLHVHSGTAMVLAVFTGNDLEESFTHTDVADVVLNGPLEAAGIALSSYRRRSVLRQLVDRARVGKGAQRVVIRSIDGCERPLLFYKPYMHRRSATKQGILSHANYGNMEHSLQAITDLARARSIPLNIVMFPTKAEVYGWILDETIAATSHVEESGFAMVMREFCQANDVRFLDLTPHLQKRAHELLDSRGQLLWWFDDTHWNTHGHDLAAEAIYDQLLKPSAAASGRSATSGDE